MAVSAHTDAPDGTHLVHGTGRRLNWAWPVLGAWLAVIIIGLSAVQAGYRVHDVLTPRHLQNAVFGPAPAPWTTTQVAARLWSDLRGHDGAALLLPLLPAQSGILWLSLVVAAAVAVDPTRWRGTRNVDIVLLAILSLLLYDITRFLDALADPLAFRLMDVVFTAIVAISTVLAIRAVWWSRRDAIGWTPALPAATLAMVAALLIGLSVAIVLVREPDDAGIYTNLGAQRLRERGLFPYGDPMLTGSAGAGYGPVLFLAPLPFQLLLDPRPVNRRSPDAPDLDADPAYYMPPMQASQLATLTFHLLGVAALFVSARRLAGTHVAWAIVVLYTGSAFVLGVGGTREMVGGVTFVSHIAPTALVLLAFALLEQPLLAGVCLALAVATVFAPLFFIPAWVGYQWHDRRARWRFVSGLALAALVLGGPVLARSRALPGRSVLGTVVHDTVGHHQGSDMYGLSPFGFWGHRDGWRAALRTELVPGLAVSSPMFAAVCACSFAGFFLGRHRTPRQLAALTAALGIVGQLWKIHGTGVYVNWYFPFLLLGLFAVGPLRTSADASPRTAA